VTARFTPKQGAYLSFIRHYAKLHGRSRSEAEMQQFFMVSPPSVHQMVMALEKRGLITRRPGVARSLRVLVASDQLPTRDDVHAQMGSPWTVRPMARRVPPRSRSHSSPASTRTMPTASANS
jgi:SOS-response transcriptional repressor LexA